MKGIQNLYIFMIYLDKLNLDKLYSCYSQCEISVYKLINLNI